VKEQHSLGVDISEKNQTAPMGKAFLALGGRTNPLLAQPFQTP